MAEVNLSQGPTSSYITINGLRFHYLDWGGEGPPIVVFHATGFLGRVYRPIALDLRSIGHVYSLDQGGHGDSEVPPVSEISWYRTADDLEAWLVAIGLSGVRAFGHSAGGTAIIAVAERRPDLIARAAVVEPVLIDASDPEGRPSQLYERTLKRKPSFDSIDAMYANFAAKPPYSSWRDDVLRDYCEYGTRPSADGRRSLRCPPAIEAQIYQTARDFDGLGRLLASKVPTLVVFGEKSDSPGIEFADQIRRAHEVRIANGCGHLAPMEQPDQIAQMAVDFLSAG